MTTCVLWVVILLSQNWTINFELVDAIDVLRPFKCVEGRKNILLVHDAINIRQECVQYKKTVQT